MNWVKGKYQFELADITTVLNVVAVILTLCGFWWSTLIFVVSCLINLIYTIVKVKRINLLVLNIALLIFNVSFLI